MAAKKPYNLRVRITPEMYQRIKILASDNRTSKSVVTRMLLLKALTEIDNKCERDEED